MPFVGRYALKTAPAVEPVTFADVQAQCRIGSSAELAYIESLIIKARRYVESLLQRQLVSASWYLYLGCFPDEIELRKPPVSSVTAITYTDLAGDTQTLAASGYQLDTGAPDSPGRIMPAYGDSWPDTRADTYNAVRVEFVAGYGATGAAVPDDIRHAILLLVSHWYEAREPIVTGTIVAPVPFTVDALLAGHQWGAYA